MTDDVITQYLDSNFSNFSSSAVSTPGAAVLQSTALDTSSFQNPPVLSVTPLVAHDNVQSVPKLQHTLSVADSSMLAMLAQQQQNTLLSHMLQEMAKSNANITRFQNSNTVRQYNQYLILLWQRNQILLGYF